MHTVTYGLHQSHTPWSVPAKAGLTDCYPPHSQASCMDFLLSFLLSPVLHTKGLHQHIIRIEFTFLENSLFPACAMASAPDFSLHTVGSYLKNKVVSGALRKVFRDKICFLV